MHDGVAAGGDAMTRDTYETVACTVIAAALVVVLGWVVGRG